MVCVQSKPTNARLWTPLWYVHTPILYAILNYYKCSCEVSFYIVLTYSHLHFLNWDFGSQIELEMQQIGSGYTSLYMVNCVVLVHEST